MLDIKKIMIIADVSIWLFISMSFVNMIKWLHFFMISSWMIIAIFEEQTMIMIESFLSWFNVITY
jgi:hypothetical protein